MTNAIIKGLKSSKTTIAGSALALVLYGQQVGAKLPSNEGEWVSFLVSALLAILSLLAKDADKR